MFYCARFRVCDNMCGVSRMVRAQILVTGRVQGVFFRAFAQERAVALGLTGWVKNLPDGRVEVLAEGEQSQVDELIAVLKQGPPLSYVERAEVLWQDYLGEFDNFRITW